MTFESTVNSYTSFWHIICQLVDPLNASTKQLALPLINKGKYFILSLSDVIPFKLNSPSRVCKYESGLICYSNLENCVRSGLALLVKLSYYSYDLFTTTSANLSALDGSIPYDTNSCSAAQSRIRNSLTEAAALKAVMVLFRYLILKSKLNFTGFLLFCLQFRLHYLNHVGMKFKINQNQIQS